MQTETHIAAERNKAPIAEQLAPILAHCKQLLEVASGNGIHARHMAAQLPDLLWQCSEHPLALPALQRSLRDSEPANLVPPLALDIAARPWPLPASLHIDAIYSANMLHIVSWPLVEAFFAESGRILPAKGLLAVYGPFLENGRYDCDSNARFDAFLRNRDPDSGLRDRQKLALLAESAGLVEAARHKMPSNNQLLIWRRCA